MLVFGLVEFIKKIGLTGFWLTICSLVLSVLSGFAWRIVSAGIPVAVSDWIVTVVIGFVIGLTASGVYDFFNKRFPG